MGWLRARPRGAVVRGIGAAVLLALGGLTAGGAAAQTLPPTNQGPQLTDWGPGLTAPMPEGPPVTPPADAFVSATGAAPFAVPPATRLACAQDLRGTWLVSGTQTAPAPLTYVSNAAVQQFGNYLLIERPQEGLTYYGLCDSGQIQFDVYQGGRFVGYQAMVVVGPAQLQALWVRYVGGLAAGQEAWQRQ
jgi:hypothetical protein